MNINEKCYGLAKECQYDFHRVMQRIEQFDLVTQPVIQDQFITWFDSQYPSSLKELRKPPIHLCFKGNLSLLQRPMVAVIGSRLHSEYGEWVCKEIIHRLDSSIVIVSGLAQGIDGIAHRAAIASGKQTIGIIGSGFQYCYPSQHQALLEEMSRNHLVLSEYQFETPIKRYHFPARNRIIAGLADFLLVIESKIKSGSSTTVREALELGKDIYCIPHRLNDPLGAGNHLMIQEGANIVYDLDEFCCQVHQQFDLTNKKIPLR